MKIKTCVFPVAGLGKRFLPATKSIPKEMLVVVDKPLIQYAVEEAKAAGVERFIFVTSQGKAAIEDHFDSNARLVDELRRRGALAEIQKVESMCLEPGQAIYVRQSQPLGLGHAVLCAKQMVDDEEFAVILADDLVLSQTPCLVQMTRIYKPTDGNMVAAMEVPLDQTHHYGILSPEQVSGRKMAVKSIVEKPAPGQAPSRMAVIGRYILKHSVFDFLETVQPGTNGEIQLTDALSAMIPPFGLTGYLCEGQRFDCGMKGGWLAANLAFAYANPELRAALKKTWRELCESR